MTTNTTTHTSTPWKVGVKHPCRIMMKPPDGKSDYAHHLIAATCELQDEGTETEQQKIDAAHIVRCVNEREELLQAFKRLHHVCTGSLKGYLTSSEFVQCQQALARAEREEG